MNTRIPGFLIKSQQYYLKELGFYTGPIHGSWTPECREALNKFKQEATFQPANPRRNTDPFLPFERLPAGYKWDIFDGQRGIIKTDNLPYLLSVQKLVDGILEIDDQNAPRRNAYEVLGMKPTSGDEEEKSDSISDYI